MEGIRVGGGRKKGRVDNRGKGSGWEEGKGRVKVRVEGRMVEGKEAKREGWVKGRGLG